MGKISRIPESEFPTWADLNAENVFNQLRINGVLNTSKEIERKPGSHEDQLNQVQFNYIVELFMDHVTNSQIPSI